MVCDTFHIERSMGSGLFDMFLSAAVSDFLCGRRMGGSIQPENAYHLRGCWNSDDHIGDVLSYALYSTRWIDSENVVDQCQFHRELQENTKSSLQGRIFGFMSSMYAICYPAGMAVFYVQPMICLITGSNTKIYHKLRSCDCPCPFVV